MGQYTVMKQLLRSAFMNLAPILLEMLIPARCLLCGLSSSGDRLCEPCLASLPVLENACGQCGIPLAQDSICGPCNRTPPPCDRIIPGLVYGFPVNSLVRRFKFKRDLACGQVLCESLHRAIVRSSTAQTHALVPDLPPPGMLVPVPLHRTRQWARVFNQAEFLAHGLSDLLEVPVRSNLIHRVRRTPSQSGLPAIERRRNLKGAFSCRRINARHIAVVDDVMTTGSTLYEVARTLKRAGAQAVTAYVAARAPLTVG
jgi:ComF family protein